MLDADGACLSPNSKPHICEHCNAAFRSSYHLRRHVLIHTGERLSVLLDTVFMHLDNKYIQMIFFLLTLLCNALSWGDMKWWEMQKGCVKSVTEQRKLQVPVSCVCLLYNTSEVCINHIAPDSFQGSWNLPLGVKICYQNLRNENEIWICDVMDLHMWRCALHHKHLGPLLKPDSH